MKKPYRKYKVFKKNIKIKVLNVEINSLEQVNLNYQLNKFNLHGCKVIKTKNK